MGVQEAACYDNQMKKILLLLFVTLSLNSVVKGQDVITYFSAGPNICTPVKVKTNLGTFYVYDDEKAVNGYVSSIEAWDCQGRKILDLEPDRRHVGTTKPDKYWYVFNTLYPESSQNESNYNNEDTSYSSSNSNTGSSWDKLIDNVGRGTQFYDPAYPNFTLQAGVSRVHGEFIRGKACLGGRTGFVLYGGIGQDFLFDAKNEKYIGHDAKKMAWHVGLGMYGGDLDGINATGEFAFLIDYAETPLVRNGSVNMWLEGTWYFGANGHFGAFAGIGCSIGDIKKENQEEKKKQVYNFIWEIGLAYRLF